MSRKVTVTRDYINDLKADRERLRKKLEDCEKDREKFREFALSMLKEQTTLLSNNKYYTPAHMIERLSKLMNRVENWYWG